MKITVVIREVGKLQPDYSLDFDLPEVPRTGEYISIQRPDKREPFGEDVIVRNVWWRLTHPETAGFASEPKIGKVQEIIVECEPALSPYSSDAWKKLLIGARDRGHTVEDMTVERFVVPEAEFLKLND
ncbi:hypothetical protein HB779_02030 [Phyllobacterium sp. 628]|uniref:hypothetical protein n=1 Tax=Phyllobacterium sp. 628 TaxID=2718938 RepID=UPI001662442E|nr:hypothetical protein [Phyllobacterium sp. 628]QND50800.1 hypothetical protein HB779_02030 [Phyllobacterium sp. 628]